MGFFHTFNLAVHHFSFNTPGATPSAAFNKYFKKRLGMEKQKGKKDVWEEGAVDIKTGEAESILVDGLRKIEDKSQTKEMRTSAPKTLADDLEKWCSATGEKHANFGFKGSNNCMRA